MSKREELTPEEEISFRHLVHFLGKYDRYLVVPKSLKTDYPDFGIKRFSDEYFGSTAANTKLMLSRQFYEAFLEYTYILIYHLDALVFSDQLMQWCEMDFDFIGAPWVNRAGVPCGVGNGGFSLRKIDGFLKVIDSPRYAIEPAKYWKAFCASKPKYLQYLNLPRRYAKHLKLLNSARREISRFTYNEDRFWSTRATHYYPKFKIAPIGIALRFAFECAPRLCFEKTNALPFGCHAWHVYDRDFWEPYLLK